MLITELISPMFLGVKCNYSNDYVTRFRQIPGAKFEKDNKRWVIPVGAFEWFEEAFQGEIVYKTPRWVILDEPMPDYTKMYQLKHNVDIPKLKLEPFDYQKYGIKWMIDRLIDNGFLINADDVGLGKTIEAIGSMKYAIENLGVKRVLIACKKSIKRQWCSEINKFTDLDKEMCIVPIEGTTAKRKKLYKEFVTHNKGIMVMNYHIIMHDFNILERLGFQMLVIDEAHCVKARTGAQNSALGRIGKKAKYIEFLTGTPIMSKPEDIFGVIQIASKDYFGLWKDFDQRYIKHDFNGRYLRTVGYMHLDELREKVQNIVLRRTEFEVTLELPETVFNKIECNLDTTQRKLIEAINDKKTDVMNRLEQLRNKVTKTPEMLEKEQSLEGMLKGFIASEQAIANDPRLFLVSKSKYIKYTFGPLVPATYACSNKTQALIELVQTILDADEKVIIFSKFETSAKMIKKDIENMLKEKALLYSGSVDDETREDNITMFRNRTDYNILIGTEALAEGVNLQVANHVINFDQPYTPAIKTQRIGRARRVGSKSQHVFVHDLITEDSEDVKLLEKLEKAQGLFDGVVSLNKAQSQALKKVMATQN